MLGRRDSPHAVSPSGRSNPNARRRRLLFVVLSALAAVIGVCAAFVLHVGRSESNGPPSTDTDSSALPNDAARLAFLQRYLRPSSPVEVAAFHIVYHDNGFAPSDYAMTILVKTEAHKVPGWRHDAKPLPARDIGACRELASRDPRLALRAEPEFFGSPQCWRALFENDGIVCISCRTL